MVLKFLKGFRSVFFKIYGAVRLGKVKAKMQITFSLKNDYK